MKTSIAVIGTGRMGSALVTAFLETGHRVDIWNRTKAKCEPLAALGARIAPTVLDAVAAAEVVVLNVTDYAASARLLQTDAVASALRGKLLVQFTSGTPSQAREMGAWAQHNEIHYLDGAIMAPPNLIGDPGCTIVYSGAGTQFEQYADALRALGGNAIYVGRNVGHASALDNALLAIVWGAMFGALHGAAICQAEQFPLTAYAESIDAVLPAIGESTTDIVNRIEHGQFAGETSLGTVNLHSGGVLQLIELCKEHGIHHAVQDVFQQHFQAAIDAGHGSNDFAVLSKFMR